MFKLAGLRTPVLVLTIESPISSHRRAESALKESDDGDQTMMGVNATVTTVLSIPATSGGPNVTKAQATDTLNHNIDEDDKSDEEHRRRMQISYNGAGVCTPY